MNTIGNYEEKPNAYFIGKYHENWAFSSIKYCNNAIVKKWLKNLTNDLEYLEVVPQKPESHIEKTDFFILLKLKAANGVKKITKHGISAKSGTTGMCGQIYRGSITNVIKQNFISDTDELGHQHKEWLTQRVQLKLINNLNVKNWENWYSNKWNEIIEAALFGNKTFSSSLLLSNLDYDYLEKKLLVTDTVLIDKNQVLKDMKTLSSQDNVKINFNSDCICSGLISIKRAGGSNGEKGAEDWQVRLDRSKYIKWIKEHRPETVWTK